MAQRNIGANWNRDNRNNINDNFSELYAKYQEYFTEITEDLRADLIEGAHIEIKGYYETAAELPTSAESGDTYFVIETGEWQRYDGEVWDVVAKTDTSEFVALRADFTSLEDKYDTFIQLVDSSITTFKQEVNNTIDDKLGDVEAGVQDFIDLIEGQIVYVVEENIRENEGYIRYSDGYQIVWGVEEGLIPESDRGVLWTSESRRHHFEKEFIETKPIRVSLEVYAITRWAEVTGPSNANYCTFRQVSATRQTTAYDTHIIATGWWK